MRFETILSAYQKSIERGYSRQTLVFGERLRQMWTRRRRMTPFCAANLERAVRHVTQGMSVPDAAAREDVEEGALLHEIQRRGGLKALRPRLTDWTERKESAKTEEALRLIRLGASVRDASQGSGATLSAIRSALARRGGMMVFMERVKHGK